MEVVNASTQDKTPINQIQPQNHYNDANHRLELARSSFHDSKMDVDNTWEGEYPTLNDSNNQDGKTNLPGNIFGVQSK